MANIQEFTTERLALARGAIEHGRNAADVKNEYGNLDLALAIIDGCRAAITMADAHDPNTVVQELEIASAHLASLQECAAEPSVKIARQHIDETITALRP
jgi:hypothetical protein